MSDCPVCSALSLRAEVKKCYQCGAVFCATCAGKASCPRCGSTVTKNHQIDWNRDFDKL